MEKPATRPNPLLVALRIMRASLGDIWADMWTALVCDLIWLLSVVLILPGPPVTLALVYFANRRAHEDLTDLKDLWHGFRLYWKPAWRWGILNLLILSLLVGDFYLTGRSDPASPLRFIQSFYLAVVLVWLMVQFYALPFLIEQEQPSLRQALRNGAVMLGQNIVFSVCFGFGLLLICLVGIPLFFLTVGFGPLFLAFAANRAVLMRLGRD